jgi:hypothetical protein
MIQPVMNFDQAHGELDMPVRNTGRLALGVSVHLDIGAQQALDLLSPPVAAGQAVTFSVALSPLMPAGSYTVTATIDRRYADPAAAVSQAAVTVGALNSLSQLPAPNLIVNPDFEAGTQGWNVNAVTHLDPAGHDGSAALRLDKADFAGTNFFHVSTEGLALQANMPYVYGAWLKTRDLRESVRLVAQGKNNEVFWDQAQPPSADNGSYGGTQDWVLRVGQIPAQPSAGQTAITLLLSNYLQGSVWLDDAFLIPVFSTRFGN